MKLHAGGTEKTGDDKKNLPKTQNWPVLVFEPAIIILNAL